MKSDYLLRNFLARNGSQWLPRIIRPLRMKKFLAFALPLFCTASVFAADVAYTQPVGGMQVTFAPGTRFTGMTLVNPAVARGAVSAVSGNVITLTDASANVGATLTSGTAYYVEFTAGPTSTYVGDRFDVDVAATKTSANNTLTVSLTANNTLGSVPAAADLAGYSVVIRPHVTIGQLFGTKDNQLMQGSTVVASADQLLFFSTALQSFETYFFLRNAQGTTAQWRKIGGGSTSRDNEIIAPGQGLAVIRNSGTPVTLTWLGEVRTNSFAQPLGAGYTLVAQPWPTSASATQRLMTYADGWTGSTISTQADKFLVYQGGSFQTYFLLRNASGSTEQWRLIGGGSTNRNNELLFGADTSVLISKITSDLHYSVPYIY